MKYLPFENITYTTNLSLEEITRRLNKITVSNQFSGINILESEPSMQYRGVINIYGFTLTRNIAYRNSFLPIINGTFNNGTNLEINVKMRLRPFVTVFIIVWMSIAAAATIKAAAAFFSHVKSSPNNFMLLIPAAMLMFGYLLTLGAFKFESIQSKKDFKAIFEAEVIEN